MKITALTLQNFKRFTHLEIKNIPTEAKLVLLVGANGSGKSSVFDAFEWMRRSGHFQNTRTDLNTDYFKKKPNDSIRCELTTAEGKHFKWRDTNTTKINLPTDFFYGRPSLRIVPTIENVRFDETAFKNNEDAPNRFIEIDNKFNIDVFVHVRGLSLAGHGIGCGW